MAQSNKEIAFEVIAFYLVIQGMLILDIKNARRKVQRT